MERRRHERTDIEPLEIMIEIIESSYGTFENVHLFINDVSKEGISFVTSVEFKEDEMIHFHLPSLNLSPYISGRIAWKKAEGAKFVYGFDLSHSDFNGLALSD